MHFIQKLSDIEVSLKTGFTKHSELVSHKTLVCYLKLRNRKRQNDLINILLSCPQIQVIEDDRRSRSGDFVATQRGAVPPLVTTTYTAEDRGTYTVHIYIYIIIITLQ